jgi:hypothetical protein
MLAALRRFQYWLGSPRGALVYFGVGYGLVALAWLVTTWQK